MRLGKNNKFVGIGGTFDSHSDEDVKWPSMWIEPNEAVIYEDDNIELPARAERVTFGPEPTVVLTKSLWRASSNEAAESIGGFTVSNDVSIIGEWPGHPSESMSSHSYKMLPTFRPVFSELSNVDLEDLHAAKIRGYIDGARILSESMRNMRFSIPEMLADISDVIALNEGDLIGLGEPEVPTIDLKNARSVSCEIEGIGAVENHIEICET